MKPWFYPVLAILGVILLAMVLVFTITGSNFRIGVVDPGKIISESKLGKSYAEEVNAKRAEILTKAKKAEEEKDQAEVTKLIKEFEKFAREKQDDFAKKMNNKIAEIAKKKRLKAVFPENVVNYANKTVDITDEVIKALE